jgi:SAM-dependent methyltransferase
LEKKSKSTALEIGVGEGFNLIRLKNQGYKVRGFDFSRYAVERANPDIAEFVIDGDIDEFFEDEIKSNSNYDLIWIDNVLEHTHDPLLFLKKIYKILSPQGLIFIEVPNDFSLTQKKLIDRGKIDSRFWICPPDHINYFNRYGLQNICREIGLIEATTFSDFPIDFFLFNDKSNYRKMSSVGKNCFEAVVDIESLYMDLGLETYFKITNCFAESGLGRCICGIYKK